MKYLFLFVIPLYAQDLTPPTLTSAVPFDKVIVYYYEVDDLGNKKPMGEGVYNTENYAVHKMDGIAIEETHYPEEIDFINDSTYLLVFPYLLEEGTYLIEVNEVYDLSNNIINPNENTALWEK